jgi:transcription elongation GreA/GreB family factor
MGWAWLSTLKGSRTPREILDLGRVLLVHLSDGNELRDEILALYRQTHEDRDDLEKWIDLSGIKGQKSVRRALRFLDCGLDLAEGRYLVHRTDDGAAQIVSIDVDAGEAEIRTGRRTVSLDLDKLINDYDPADANDFRVLSQLDPTRIEELAAERPADLVIGILRARHGKLDRDELKLILVPRYVEAAGWTDWWTRFRGAARKSPNLRFEGRSPMFVIYDPVGRTPEQELWETFEKADAPRQWLECAEAYFRSAKSAKNDPDPALLKKVEKFLVDRVKRFLRHKEPEAAFATALVVDRLASAGFIASTDAHDTALAMLQKADEPAALVAGLGDMRLWPIATACVEQAFPDRWPEVFAEMLLHAPMSQCETIAQAIERAGKPHLLIAAVDQILGDPGRHTDALMWIWKGPATGATIPVPPVSELLSSILSLVGPARVSEGKTSGQSVNEMRAKIRTGLAAKDYERFKACLDGLDDAMAQTIRRQVERADGLGPAVREDLNDLIRMRFGHLYLRPRVAMWDDESVLYFTAGGLRAKQDEVDELVNVKMRENARAIGEAASHGDLSENSEYKFALEERDLLRARVAKLNYEISMAKLLLPEDVPQSHVSLGHRVRLRPTNGGEAATMTILGVGDGDFGRHVYSYQTPIARQVLGAKPGDNVKLTIDDAETEFVIDGLENALAG